MPTLHRMQTLAAAALLCATAAVSARRAPARGSPDTPKPVVVRTDDARKARHAGRFAGRLAHRAVG